MLSKDGELYRHLKRIAKSADSSAYILQHTPCGLFPAAYPTPPEDPALKVKEVFLADFCGTRYMREHLPQFSAEFYLPRKDTPGWTLLEMTADVEVMWNSVETQDGSCASHVMLRSPCAAGPEEQPA